MTPERVQSIREAWRRCSHQAIRHFRNGGVAWRAAIPPDLPGPVARYEPDAATLAAVEVFTFVHETRRDRPSAPQEWRVVCEGVVLQTGVYP